MKVVILNDEGAPGKVEVRLTVVDSLAELLPNRVDDEQDLLLVRVELLRLLPRQDSILAESNFIYLYYEHHNCNCQW